MTSLQSPADAQVPVPLSHQELPEARTQLHILRSRVLMMPTLRVEGVSSSGASGHQDPDFGRISPEEVPGHLNGNAGPMWQPPAIQMPVLCEASSNEAAW